MLPPWFVPWCSLAILINAFSSPADRNKQTTKPSHSIIASLGGVKGFLQVSGHKKGFTLKIYLLDTLSIPSDNSPVLPVCTCVSYYPRIGKTKVT